ncbi:metallophosphoesterase family protein [Granulicella sibirica]|nr:metallophosphoesterase [Granulicella sibirica]
MNRRRFLSLTGATLGAASLPAFALAPPSEPFTFLFFTDAHLQPELNGVLGTGMAFRHGRTIKADFAINGGDHVFDSNAVSKPRATQLYDLYGKTEQDLGLKMYHVLGNHDVFAVTPSNTVSINDNLYGKNLYEERFGKTYYSFDHKGCHFIVLDSIVVNADRSYEGMVDAAQLQWLSADLAALPPHMPVIVAIHYPVVTAFVQYEAAKPSLDSRRGLSLINSNEVIDRFTGYNVIGVLQGHTHVNELVVWKGVPYHTCGAVSGNWWHGTRMGTPEGFTVVEVANGKMATRYETYGFRSIEPQNT